MCHYPKGLLFYLSGEQGLTADYAVGKGTPDFQEGVTTVSGGADGKKAIACMSETLRYAYAAEHQVYAARGTIAFFVRPVYAVGETAFPLFRVSFADHSSWDAVFLRIDYNGSGFDAFVTDQNLERVRVSTQRETPWQQDEWIHLAFAWDEAYGVRLYENGTLVASRDEMALLDAQLDRFGPFSRLISPWNVQSMFNYIRGGEIDELAIYDHMLSDEQVRELHACRLPDAQADNFDWQRLPHAMGWLQKNGWNDPERLPFELQGPVTIAKKVEIHDAFDQKRWWWKACDGIRETTWPGVINRSSLKGRYDYFLLPDWDCYSTSGKEITFQLPDEEWNHIECTGGAYGTFDRIDNGKTYALSERSRGQEKSTEQFLRTYRGGDIRFTNTHRERPISDFSVYHVRSAEALPQGAYESFTFGTLSQSEDAFTAKIKDEIFSRHVPDERRVMVAGGEEIEGDGQQFAPLTHLIVPGDQLHIAALDKVAITFPKVNAFSALGAKQPVRVRVHDPIWTARGMADFSFCLGDQAQTLVLDLRKRIRRQGDGLYISIYTASDGMDSRYFSGVTVHVYGIEKAQALEQHVQDRFTQVKDLYAHMVEERAGDPRYKTFQRFYTDVSDLLRVAPDHYLAQCYLYDSLSTCNAQLSDVPRPHYTQTQLRQGIPAWAQRQCEYLEYLKRFYTFWINGRQIDNGEFGGGLSDDGDLTSWWPGVALCGLMPEEILASLKSEWRAIDEQGMLTNGMSSIQTDEMHVFEEGITCLGQTMLLDYGEPNIYEHGMRTAKAVESLTAINQAGHRHFMSSYYSGTVMATEAPWNRTTSNSYLVCHPLYLLAEYNLNPYCQEMAIALADALLAHYRDGQMYAMIVFDTDADSLPTTPHWRWALQAAYKLTGDKKYREPIKETVAYRKYGDADKQAIKAKYEKMIWDAAIREYINTLGHLWVDRVVIDIEQIQLDRLGGVAHQRFEVANRHFLSWRFTNDEAQTSVAILTPEADERHIRVLAYNLSQSEVQAQISLWNILSGAWEMRMGIDADECDRLPEDADKTRLNDFGHGRSVTVTIPSGVQSVITFDLITRGEDIRLRPDLAISHSDIRREIGCLRVTVHSIGHADAPETTIALYDPTGRQISTCRIAALAAPKDMRPSTTDAILPVPHEADLTDWSVVIDPEETLSEITRCNNRVVL